MRCLDERSVKWPGQSVHFRCDGLTSCFLPLPATLCSRPLCETPDNKGTGLRVVVQVEAGKQRVAPSACVSGSAPVCGSQLARLQGRARHRHSCRCKSGARRGAPLAASSPATPPIATPATQNTASLGRYVRVCSLLPGGPAAGPSRRPLDRCQSSTSAPLIYFRAGQRRRPPATAAGNRHRQQLCATLAGCPFSTRERVPPPSACLSSFWTVFLVLCFFPARSPEQAETLGGSNGGSTHEAIRRTQGPSPCIAETPLGGSFPGVLRCVGACTDGPPVPFPLLGKAGGGRHPPDSFLPPTPTSLSGAPPRGACHGSHGARLARPAWAGARAAGRRPKKGRGEGTVG